MARTKDRQFEKKQISSDNEAGRIWDAGFYGRISFDRNGEKLDSIEAQKLIAVNFAAEKKDIRIIKYYVDDGVTGTKFDRDSFSQLLDDVRTKTINCIIVKDLSRFGRNLGEVSNYIEKIFPFMGVRFIAVNDAYDSEDPNCDSMMLSVMIKNLVNDMYAKDASKKCSDTMKIRMQRGDYCGGDAPYGYKRAKNDNGYSITVPDKLTAPYVRKIYEKFTSGESYDKITKWLNDSKLNAPREYARTGELFRGDECGKYWHLSTVKQILCNKHYLGHNYSKKTYTSLTCGVKNKLLPEEQWIETLNAHEAIIDESLFNRAQEIAQKKSQALSKKIDTASYMQVGKKESKYIGIIKCGLCGRKMLRRISKKTRKDTIYYRYYYLCLTFVSISAKMCRPNRWNEEILDELVMHAINRQFDIAEETLKKLDKFNRKYYKTYIQILDKEETKIISLLARCEQMKLDVYEKYVVGEFDTQNYKCESDRLDLVKQELEGRRKEIKEEIGTISSLEKKNYKWLDDLVSSRDKIYLTREVVESLISEIRLYDDKRLDIVFLFQDQIEELQKKLEKGESICKSA